MKTNRELPILDEHRSSSRQVNRREWIRRMLGGITTGLAFPGLAVSHPVHKYLAKDSTLDMADAQAATSGWTPTFLDAYQAATLAVLADRIVPGSSKAQVERFIDTLLSVDSRDDQQRFLNSLAAMEGESLQRYSHSFKDLTEAQQNEILTAASTAESGHGERRDGSTLGPPVPLRRRNTTPCATSLRI